MKKVEIDGDEACLTEWCRQYGITKQLLYWRLRHGWDMERAVTQPTRKYRAGRSGQDQGQSADAQGEAVG